MLERIMSEDHDDSVGSSPEDESLQRRRIQRMRTLDALADGIAQDISDLLHSAKVRLQISHEDTDETEDVDELPLTQDDLDRTLSSLNEIEGLVERFLALSREDRGGAAETVDMVSLVRGVLSLAESSFPPAFTLRTRFDEGCRVIGVSSQLQQLVANLITNAGARMEGRGEEQPTVIDTSVQKVAADPDLAGEYLDLEPGTYVHLAVSNTAEGEPRPGQEAPGTTVAVDEDDLHLSIAHEIVADHDGAMTVREETGEGITYNVYLPAVSESEDASVPERPAPSSPASDQRILVVDDDKTVRTLEKVRLSRLGHEVVTRSDAEETLSLVREFPNAFTVVLVDYHMPGMSGLELVHALRDEGCDASVVLMTGLSAQISEAKARVVGIDHILRKPVESQELHDLLARLGS